ncbi:MAG TPA: hypothetical protein VHC22_12295 [Pirellulales bacterium]|nr:hypothetical protein [Pirellulales bacterium]
MPRQFSLKTLLWLMACAACFCGGMATYRHVYREQIAFDHAKLTERETSLRNTANRLNDYSGNIQRDEKKLRKMQRRVAGE